MNWLSRFFHKPPESTPERRVLATLLAAPAPAIAHLESCRFVVVDVESTGLDTRKDLLLSIGAVAVIQGQIRLADQFEAVLAQPQADTRDTVLLHGLGREAIASGDIPAEVLLQFYQWSGPCVFMAFHAGFDRTMIERATREQFGIIPAREWLDLAHCLPALFPQHHDDRRSLDQWSSCFGLENHARHDAAADAMVTAELALIMLRAARQGGLKTVADLQKKVRLYQQLQQMKSV